MGFIVRLLVTAVAVFIIAYFHILDGVHVSGNLLTSSLIVAFVMGLLNSFVKPILVLLTLPVTIITLGLFYLVINVIIIYLTDYLLASFRVDGFLTALIFSFLVSIIAALLGGLVDRS